MVICLRHVEFITCKQLRCYTCCLKHRGFFIRKAASACVNTKSTPSPITEASTRQLDWNKVQQYCSPNLCEIGDNSMRGRLSKALFNISKGSAEGLRNFFCSALLPGACLHSSQGNPRADAGSGAAEAEPWVLSYS